MKKNYLLSTCVLFMSLNAAGQDYCPNTNKVKDTLNYLFNTRNVEDRTIVANCTYSKINMEYEEGSDIARFYSEALSEQIRAAKQVGEKDESYKNYLKKAIAFGEKIVVYINNNADHIPPPRKGTEGAYRKFISNALKGYSEATILISSIETNSDYSERFAKNLGKLSVLHTISRDTITDYGKAVNSCPEWNFKSGTDKSSKKFNNDLCSNACVSSVNLFYKQFDDWRKTTLIDLNNDGKENLKRLINLKCQK